MADWQKIKTEYITTDTSYRKLARKYGVTYSVIGEKARSEGWVKQREQYHNKTVAKTIAKISARQADKMSRIEDITDKLLDKLEKAVEELDLEIIVKKVKTDDGIQEVTTETREAREGGIVDRNGLRQITAALKDLKEIQKIKMDREEQEARIQNLRRQAEKDNEDSGVIEVVFAAGPEEWNE